MNTHIIVINGLPVKFSEAIPENPGAYWWARNEHVKNPELVTVGFLFSDTHLDCAGVWGSISVALRGGLWSYPLIPSIEVKNAHSEGWNDRANGDFLHEAQAWEESMACKALKQHPVP